MKTRYKILIRRINGIIHWIIAISILIAITLNAEAWIYGYKISGEFAQGIMYTIGIFGFIIGIFHFIQFKKADPFSIAWYCIFGSILLVNHLTAELL